MGTDPLARLRAANDRRAAAHLRRRLRPRTADHDGLLDLASNDYLGLSRDPRLIEGAVRAAREWGAGSTGSRLVTGTTELHARLDERLAAFAGTPAGLVFSSGYLANLAAVVTLSGPGSLIVSDRGNHASIIDACRLSRTKVVVTPHRDVAAVERALAAGAEAAHTQLVVTDAVFSVEGDLAPLAELHRAARRHGALLVVDEAHALGVLGPNGGGAAAAAGIAGEPDVVLTATLSKSLGAQGGAVLGAREVIDTLVDSGRPFIFDTGLAPASVGAALAGLDVLATDPALPAKAREYATRIWRLAGELGLRATRPAAAVVAVVLGDPQDALRAAEICAAHGIRVGCFRPPSVPAGRACLRITAPASLTDADLAVLSKALGQVADERTPYPHSVTPEQTGRERTEPSERDTAGEERT